MKCIGLLGSLKLPDSLSKLLVITKSSLVIKKLKNTKSQRKSKNQILGDKQWSRVDSGWPWVSESVEIL